VRNVYASDKETTLAEPFLGFQRDALVIGGGYKMIPALNTQLEDVINIAKVSLVVTKRSVGT
jgi:hypothetical protein